ncbi:hypothetical protein [Pedococcus sp. 5OH_020]|uniref:hypothetical protein n=1 Tax=Pedococcus sp. 5OH_020 TaxID=2989814 RepID=UPI0022E9ABAD|nr:hypothetical protein [Pedococcus sp. 5OH_020]
MNVHRIARLTLTIATATVLTLLAVGPADARQDAGPPTVQITSPFKNPVQRVGTQIVRGDELSGAGVSAPLHLPER